MSVARVVQLYYSTRTTTKRVYFFIGVSISLPSKNTKSPTFRAYKKEDKKNRP